MGYQRFIRICSVFVLFMAGASSSAFAKSHSGTITLTADLSGHGTKDEAEIWIPYPVSDQEQNITEVKISGDYAASALYTDSTNSTPMLYARWAKGAESRKLVFSFKADRKELLRRNFPLKHRLQ